MDDERCTATHPEHPEVRCVEAVADHPLTSAETHYVAGWLKHRGFTLKMDGLGWSTPPA